MKKKKVKFCRKVKKSMDINIQNCQRFKARNLLLLKPFNGQSVF